MASFPTSYGTTVELTPTQLSTLISLIQPLFQSHSVPKTIGSITKSIPPEKLEKFFQLSFDEILSKRDPNNNVNLSPYLQTLLSGLVVGFHPQALKDFQGTLNILGTRPGSWALSAGKVGVGNRFEDLSLEDREKIILAWGSSSLPIFRKLFQTFTRLPMATLYSAVEAAVDGTGYPFRGDPNLHDPSQSSRLHPSIHYDFLDLDPNSSSSSTPFLTSTEGKGKKKNTKEERAKEQQLDVIETEVLIIGSGAGGGVVAKELTEAGHRVLVLEKATYLPTEILRSESTINSTGDEFDGESQHIRRAHREMYESGTGVVSKDGSIAVLAGSTFGGGTTINWSASIRTPYYLRESWAKAFNLPHFLTSSFSNSIEAVCSRMGVSAEHLEDSIPNQLTVEGCKRLGYRNEKIPQNTGGHKHPCGLCGSGCPFGEKQGTVQTFLLDAKNTGRGKFAINAKVIRILFSSAKNPHQPTMKNLSKFSYHPKNRNRAVGALVEIPEFSTSQPAQQPNRKRLVVVSAIKSVVVSCGALNSPAVLLRSGLGPSGSGFGTEKGWSGGNKNIGKNLHLHPSGLVTGVFDRVVKPWNGSIMTNLVSCVANKDGSHFGSIIETMQSSIAVHAINGKKWEGSLNHKIAMSNFNQAATHVVIVRDMDAGSIILDPNGNFLIDYTISKYDADSFIQGILASCDIWLSAGAKQIVTPQLGIPPFVPQSTSPSVNDEDFLAWKALVEKTGVRDSKMAYGSAHQMGSCRMGDKSSNSVVDPKGRVWGAKGLYVADASVFPQAAGVNPMITTMSIAHSIAQFIKFDLANDEALSSVGQLAHSSKL